MWRIQPNQFVHFMLYKVRSFNRDKCIFSIQKNAEKSAPQKRKNPLLHTFFFAPCKFVSLSLLFFLFVFLSHTHTHAHLPTRVLSPSVSLPLSLSFTLLLSALTRVTTSFDYAPAIPAYFQLWHSFCLEIIIECCFGDLLVSSVIVQHWELCKCWVALLQQKDVLHQPPRVQGYETGWGRGEIT